MTEKQYQTIHVLVAEDDNFQRLALIDILTLCDYQVTAVENGRLARDELLREDQNINIVLLDLNMPEMDGWDLLNLMQDHEHLRKIPVIMMSFDDEQQKVASCIAVGAKDYLVKPLRIQNVKGLAKYVDNTLATNSGPSGVGLQQYKVIRTIGAGAGGSVELVIRKNDNQMFALKTISMKFMNESEKKMAQSEVVLLKVLVAPSIIRYYESFVENDTIYIIMEYAKEGALNERITEHKTRGIPIDEETILYFTAQIIIAVLFMHSKNILHRDIKTQNLFLTKENIVKLGDFGISKALGTNADLTKTLVGTPYFMSPEVCSGENYGQKADIWAIGCTIYEMVMLHRPFDNDNINILFNKIRYEEPPALHENISTDLRMLITLMLQKDPVKRPSVWDLAKIPVINQNIRKYYQEEAADDPFLKDYIFSGIKIKEPKKDANIETKKKQEKPATKQLDASNNTIDEVNKALIDFLQPYDQKTSMFHVERNVINGKQIFDWFNQYYSNSQTQQIIEILNELIDNKCIHHVLGPQNESNPLSLYRLQSNLPNMAANCYKIWNKQPRQTFTILQNIMETANEVLQEVTDQYEEIVFEDKLLSNKKYKKFMERVCELQKVYLEDNTPEERKCFFINLLQIMYFHRYLRNIYNKLKESKKQRVTTIIDTIKSFIPFFKQDEDNFYYEIGNHKFTLDDIKHGMLRGNKKHKNSSFKPFKDTDTRKQLVTPQDLRVLMIFKEEDVLPNELKFIKPDTMDEQLDEICTRFMRTYVYIDNVENDLTLHKLLEIYQDDFGKTSTDVIIWAYKYTKNIGRPDELVENIKQGELFVQYKEKFES